MNIQKITQNFTTHFPGDISRNLYSRQTPGYLYCLVEPADFTCVSLILFNNDLAAEIGLGDYKDADLPFLAAQNLPENIKTYATAYAGHQFGNWAGQLGDGRVLFAGEITNNLDKTHEIQWKGAGATPYSRFADGRAVLRSSLREYLMSESLHFLGVPTSRSLSLCLTGEEITRDIAYNGNPKKEKGAVITRIAPSFLRFGHFELLSARKELTSLQKLADYSINQNFSEIKSTGKKRYQDWFEAVLKKTADLVVDWYRIGFVHGVLNTDNMSVIGITLDYGPFSMLDAFDLNFTPNTTDLPGKRYAFGKQAEVALWNLSQFANAVFPLIEDAQFFEEQLQNFGNYFWQKHDEMLCRKFGFDELKDSDVAFFQNWQQLMTELQIDYTLFFTQLENYDEQCDIKSQFEHCLYSKFIDESAEKLQDFLHQYQKRLTENAISKEKSLKLMKRSNPKFILRNYLLYECIQEVNDGKTELLHQLLHALQHPYENLYPKFATKRPSKYDDQFGCSMLSCSS